MKKHTIAIAIAVLLLGCGKDDVCQPTTCIESGRLELTAAKAHYDVVLKVGDTELRAACPSSGDQISCDEKSVTFDVGGRSPLPSQITAAVDSDPAKEIGMKRTTQPFAGSCDDCVVWTGAY